VQRKTIALTTFARSLENISMKVKQAKIIRIQNVMPRRVQKLTGLDQLSYLQLANLNAWLNLDKTRAVLGAPTLHAVLMEKKAPKIIRIEKIMPERIQKQTGLYKLSPTELANLNAWLNLNRAKARDVLPVSLPPPAF
jgi:DNA replication protein DnaD